MSKIDRMLTLILFIRSRGARAVGGNAMIMGLGVLNLSRLTDDAPHGIEAKRSGKETRTLESKGFCCRK
jgi:hypothetical protein